MVLYTVVSCSCSLFSTARVRQLNKWSQKSSRNVYIVTFRAFWNLPRLYRIQKSILIEQEHSVCGFWGTFLAGPQPGREGLVNVVPESVKRSVPVRTRLILKSSKTLQNSTSHETYIYSVSELFCDFLGRILWDPLGTLWDPFGIPGNPFASPVLKWLKF